MIKFPRVHIAQSVLSRILDTADELGLGGGGGKGAPTPPPTRPPSEPILPDTTAPSVALDVKAHTPPPEDVPPAEPQAPAQDELGALIARGDDLISAP